MSRWRGRGSSLYAPVMSQLWGMVMVPNLTWGWTGLFDGAFVGGPLNIFYQLYLSFEVKCKEQLTWCWREFEGCVREVFFREKVWYWVGLGAGRLKAPETEPELEGTPHPHTYPTPHTYPCPHYQRFYHRLRVLTHPAPGLGTLIQRSTPLTLGWDWGRSHCCLHVMKPAGYGR